MTEEEKELFVKTQKQFFRNSYPKDVADEMCDRLDKAKKSADMLERISNLFQDYCQQFNHAYIQMFMTTK